MRVIGLTGGMGMGKSTAARVLRRQGLPVFDADAAVHCLQGPGGVALPAIAARFPGTVVRNAAGNGIVMERLDRTALRRAVAETPGALAALEAIMHPLLRQKARRFLHAARRRRVKAAVLDVPLLFEAKWDRLCDTVIVVTAPVSVQIARIRARRSMTAAEVRALLRRQMPDREKRRRADYVIGTGLSRHETRSRLLHALAAMDTSAKGIRRRRKSA